MYTQEPDYFEYLHNDVEKEINKKYPDYEENPIDWDYIERMQKRQIFFDNINELLSKYHFINRFYPNEQKYRIWFKDQHDFNKFNMLRKKSGVLKNLVPWKRTLNLDASGCMDYYIKKS